MRKGANLGLSWNTGYKQDIKKTDIWQRRNRTKHL